MATSEERLALFKAEYPHTDNVSLTGADLGVVAGYFVIIIAIGVVAMCRSNRSTVGGFFLAGRSMFFLPGDLFTGALFIQQSLKWDLYLCIFILVTVTGIMTMTGGLTAVIYTDTMQAILMVGGGLTLMAMSFSKIGGYDGLARKYPNATTKMTYRMPNTTCHETDPNSFRMLREADDDYMPWLGFLLGQTPGSIWYWCADQVIVQRLLAAKSLSHAQGATLMAGFIKVLPLFMMVMPGMISRVLYADEVACVDPQICNYVCQSEAGCSSIAYPRLVLGIMPEGLRGLMMAVMIAALMSDLDSIFNSASTLFTVDIYTKIRKNCSQREQMLVGRLFILIMVGVSIAWVPVLKETQGGQVFIYIQEITNYLAPPFAAIFLLAVLVPMVNEQGAFWALMLAFLTGVIRMILAFVYYSSGGCGKDDNRPAILKNFHYMYFSLFITLLTGVTAIVISYFTGRPHEKYLTRTTFWTRKSAPYMEETKPDKLGKDKENGFTNLGATGDNNMHVFSVEEKHHYRDPKLDEPEEDKEMHCAEKALNYVCGITNEVDEEKERQLRLHMEKVACIEQNKYAKIGLNIGLVTILSLGVFLYIFWSFWKYEP